MPSSAHLSRVISLEGTVNFRDLGGYPAGGGRSTRWRTLFRADGLSALTSTDLEVLAEFGLRTVVDLRTSAEVSAGRFPVDQLPVAFHHHPLMTNVVSPHDFNVTPGFLASTYLEMVDGAADVLAEVVRLCATHDRLPLVFHCTAGKDRTGVTSAIVLGLLGVPRSVIVEDYALSGLAMEHLRERLATQFPDARDVIMGAGEVFAADPAAMEGLLDHLEATYGGIEAYARSAGLTSDDLARLQSALLD